MDNREFTEFMQQHSQCKGIEPFLSWGRKNDTTSHFYVLDNNVLSDLAKLARTDANTFNTLMSHFKNNIFIIPQMVLEESIRNLPVQEAVDKNYLDFYSLLNQLDILVYIESLQYNYQLFADGFTSKDIAFLHYNELAMRVTSNMDVIKRLRNAKSCLDIDNAYRYRNEDAGERFIFLYTHAMLMDQVKEITILSNELSVYNIWKSNMKKSDFYNFLLIENDEEYYRKLRPLSYNGLLLKFALEKNLSGQALEQFLHVARPASVVNRNPILYSKMEINFVDKDIVTNEDFLNFVLQSTNYRLVF